MGVPESGSFARRTDHICSVQLDGAFFDHEWDVAGSLLRRTGEAVPGGTQFFEYNDFNLPYRIVNGAEELITELEYDALGARVVKRTRGSAGGATGITLDISDVASTRHRV